MNHYQNYYWPPYENRNSSPSFFPSSYSKNQSLYSPKEGFIKGNLFQNLYSEYKNYQPFSLNPMTEQDKKLQELQSISFAMHDLNLYLDTHPNDQSMVTLFNDYRREKEKKMQDYERQFGPLMVSSEAMEGNTYSWIHSPWPWEDDYV